MKIKLIISLAVFFLLLSPLTVQAQTATDSATPSPEITTQNLKERIERVVQEKKEAIKGAIDRLGTQKRGFIGEIQRISEETLSVKTSKGIRIVALSDPNITILKNQKAITIENISVGDWVVAMGFAEEDGTFTPRRLLISSQTLRPKDFRVELGTLVNIGKTTITLNSRKDSTNIEYTLEKSSVIQDIQGDEITLKEVTTDLQALVVSTTNEDDEQVIEVIRVLSDLDDNEQ